jgi:hypothetical protein
MHDVRILEQPRNAHQKHTALTVHDSLQGCSRVDIDCYGPRSPITAYIAWQVLPLDCSKQYVMIRHVCTRTSCS